jgi:hypothetical protein
MDALSVRLIQGGLLLFLAYQALGRKTKPQTQAAAEPWSKPRLISCTRVFRLANV